MYNVFINHLFNSYIMITFFMIKEYLLLYARCGGSLLTKLKRHIAKTFNQVIILMLYFAKSKEFKGTWHSWYNFDLTFFVLYICYFIFDKYWLHFFLRSWYCFKLIICYNFFFFTYIFWRSLISRSNITNLVCFFPVL